jgi:hypothetical protein
VLHRLEELGLGHPHVLGQVPGQVDHRHRRLVPLYYSYSKDVGTRRYDKSDRQLLAMELDEC